MIRNWTKFADVVDYLHRPVDGASLGVCRILFGRWKQTITLESFIQTLSKSFREGIVMLVDIAEERGGSRIDAKWSDPERCHFPIVPWLQPFDLKGMCWLYAVMWMSNQLFGTSIELHIHSCVHFKVHWESRSDTNFVLHPLCSQLAIGICFFWTAAFGIITAICTDCVRFCMRAARHTGTCQ